MTIMTLKLIDVGEDELEVRVETDSFPSGSLAELYMNELVTHLQSKSDALPDGVTIH